jgi:hypothetical protein
MPDGIFNDIRNQAPTCPGSVRREEWLMREAAAWAWAQREPELQARADAELEACVAWLIENQNPRWAHALRAARRPSPPTLREQALAALEHEVGGDYSTTKGTENDGFRVVTDTTIALIREALKEPPNG